MKRTGFTLIELLISIAITGILAAIMFNSFSQEKKRNSVKSAVHQLQTDLQKMQTNAQGGVITGISVPKGYGVYLSSTAFLNTRYTTFANFDSNQTYDPPPVDTDLRQVNFASGVTIKKLTDGSGAQVYTRLDIVFASPNGQATLTGIDGGGSHIPSSGIIVLQQSSLNICYAITVTSGVGTVSQRRLTSCT